MLGSGGGSNMVDDAHKKLARTVADLRAQVKELEADIERLTLDNEILRRELERKRPEQMR